MIRSFIAGLIVLLGLSTAAISAPPEGEAATAHLKQALGVIYRPDVGKYPKWLCSVPQSFKGDYLAVCRADDPKGAAHISFALVSGQLSLDEAHAQRHRRLIKRPIKRPEEARSEVYEVNGRKFDIRHFHIDMLDGSQTIYRPYFSSAHVLTKDGAYLLVSVGNGNQDIHKQKDGIPTEADLKDLLASLVFEK